MDTLLVQPRAATRRPLSDLSKLTIASLAGIALALVYVQAIITGQFRMDLTIFAGIMLLVSAVIATGWRWAPLLGALLSIFVVVGNRGPVIYDLTHPNNFHVFVYMVVAVSLALVGTATGIGATIQNYCGARRAAPRWTAASLAALIALGTGASLVAALPREATGASVSKETLAELPALITPGFHFDHKELKAKAGEVVALRFDNPHNAPHTFDIAELNVHVAVEAGKSGLILFKPTKPGTYTYFCDIPGHRAEGMEGKLIVEP
jgi:plastocyanin